MSWKLSDTSPIWLQLHSRLALRIATGLYPLGGRVPPVRELAAEAGVNPNTMQRALAQLESDGLVCSNRTAGRTVTEDAEALSALRRRLAETRIRDYLQSMADLGFSRDEAVKLLEQWDENPPIQNPDITPRAE